jgi:guanosine-3',5'-bis(diphosphate) 3'-pyrophosphohydrolase
VFTPKGKILRLPSGATAVDFAYAIHTDVGNRCVAAKVDRRLVPLRTPLRNGQTVEIITAKGATPNPSWSSFLVTAKARAAIRQYLKNLKRGEAVELGRRLLGSRSRSSRSTEEDSAGGHRRRGQGAEPEGRRRAVREDRPGRAPGAAGRAAPAARADDASSRAEQGPADDRRHRGLLVTYARCCFPIPNDPIMAYLSAGRGVMIHRQNCGNLAEYRKQPEKWLSVAWEATQGACSVRDPARNQQPGGRAGGGRLEHRRHRDQHRSGVARGARRQQLVALKFQLQVRDRKHLARVIKTIRRMPDVQRVFRTLA